MPADLAFGHCYAVLGDVDEATTAAVAALRRAGRSRPSVLGHARYQALLAPEPEHPTPETPAPDDLTELATLLAMTRTARDRAVVDLRARLDRADLGRALGMSPAAASALADRVADAWDRDLDPQLIAKLGPGDCLELAAVLADQRRDVLGDLAAAAPAVLAHVETCDVCTDRRRAMVSVRALFAQLQAPPTPAAVRDAARRSRRMRPMPAPPPLEPGRRRALVALSMVGVVALLAGATAGAVALTHRHHARARRVAKLVNVPPAPRLALVVTGNTAQITNRSTRTVKWRAGADVSWVEVSPSSGVVGAGQSASMQLRPLAAAPEGPAHSTITITGDDGSASAAMYETNVERPPDLAAATDGCAVNATADDTSGVGAVDLHWTDKAGSHTAGFTLDGSTYRAALPESDPLTWWATATDARGNTATTAPTPFTC